jgi:hypothetical protein
MGSSLATHKVRYNFPVSNGNDLNPNFVSRKGDRQTYR